ncbi:MAG TPA: PP2C family protein-serine/threonine phosphatase [Thermoanaerobaculaceae bacterium]|nr:PP2C family protein-serine/threonine phosphatase [Thermoanaerobaculaceae bacterium]
MARPVSVTLLAAALAFCTVAPASAQEPRPSQLGPASFRDDEVVEMTRAWRFHAGDEPSFADPSLDDSAWTPIDPVRLVSVPPGRAWPGHGWFRRHLIIDPALLGAPMVASVQAPGSVDVFLDGGALLRSNGPSDGAVANRALNAEASTGMAFTGRQDHVLAVRYSYRGAPAAGGDPGFRLTLETAAGAAGRRARERLQLIIEIASIVFAASLALLHLALFWAYPRALENLFYALWMVSFASVVLCNRLARELASESARELLARLSIFPVMAGLLCVLLTYYAVKTRPFPKSWRFFAAFAAAVAIVTALVGERLPGRAWYVYIPAMAIEVMRVERSRRTVVRSDLGIVLWAMLVQFAVVVVVILSNVGVVPAPLGDSTYMVIPLPLAVGMSVFLARRFARTNLDLERRLVEVQRLSDQVLEQERAAHAQELRQRLLEAEHARTEAEVEAARSLQLSMLPPALPSVPGLEVAALMTTASEVGGDYYDFRADPDGGLVVAIGDATGHGVAAGIMVTAVKALFASQTGHSTLAATAAECNRVLRSMNLKPLHMCLALARVTPRWAAVCTAGMPPVLIRRAASGEVEELGAGGLPLGSHLGAAWEERGAALAPGDTLLFASDGLFELEDPGGAAFGFDRAARALREGGDGTAAELVERLSGAAAAWRAGREQVDDLTLVVVRVNR